MHGVIYRKISDPAAVTALMLATRPGESTPLIDAFIQLAVEAGDLPIDLKKVLGTAPN